ncbi:MAG: hypothetical protein ACFCBV_11610 [Phycisphaerales bacterium]
MPDFIVRGADKLTGREVEHRSEAADHEAAQAVANEMGMAVESIEPAAAAQRTTTDAALDDRLRRIEEAIEVNSKLVRAIALDSAEIRRALTNNRGRFFQPLYRRMTWAVAIGILLSAVLLVVLFAVAVILAALIRAVLASQGLAGP